MHLSLLLDLACDTFGDRVAVTDPNGSFTYTQLRAAAHQMAAEAPLCGSARLVFLGVNSNAVPIGLFAAAAAGASLVPLNYRLSDTDLRRLAERAIPAAAIVDGGMAERLSGLAGLDLVHTTSLAAAPDAPGSPAAADPEGDEPALMLFTSGTTGEPKAAVLRHRHLSSYVFSTLEFASAGEDEVALVSVPPYHIAGISAIVSSTFVGRRLVYLPSFTAESWVAWAEREHVTHAMVVPTMLGRILDRLEETGTRLPALRHLSYGGGRMPVRVVERALDLLPHVGFVNAYGLTETSSTIAVLGPDDHRTAVASTDPAVRARLGSVGRPHGGIELSIRDPFGDPVPTGTTGEIWVRGAQVSGEYTGGSRTDPDGWFATHDGGHLDEAGFLFLEGRLDDVIVRGGENISPGEIEEVLRQHPAVADAAVFGEASEEWGESVTAIVVPTDAEHPPASDELRDLVATRLRSSKAPARIELVPELPYSETGKLLRRVLRQRFGPQG